MLLLISFFECSNKNFTSLTLRQSRNKSYIELTKNHYIQTDILSVSYVALLLQDLTRKKDDKSIKEVACKQIIQHHDIH